MWIEIVAMVPYLSYGYRHAPQGACELKFLQFYQEVEKDEVMPRKGHVD